MPFATEQYFLEAFLDGDAYSALADKRRFSTIDNQFFAMTSIIGDGRISGWDIELLAFPNVRVTRGTGFIDQYYVSTFDDQDFELIADSTYYFYAQRRVGIASILGPLSDVATLTYTDSGVPSQPTGFTAGGPSSSAIDPYTNIQLEWTANSEIDLDHYEIERSTYPPGDYDLIATVSEGIELYIDSAVEEDETYYYQLYAVDESGYRSPAATANYSTPLSPALPPNPMEVQILPSEGAINVLWKRPVSLDLSDIQTWQVTWTRLNSDSSPIVATTQTRAVDKTNFFTRLDDLQNGELYQVTIRAVDTKGRISEGVTKNIAPVLLLAPKDPENIATLESELVEGSVIVTLDWSDGADVYDPLIPYRYNIYVTVDGQQESNAINVPIGEAEQQVELYTFDGVEYFSIPQNTLVTFRLTSVSENGQESRGNFVRFITTNFAIPLPVGNLQSEFDADRGEVTVTWDNQIDTAYIVISVIDEEIGSDYAAAEIISEDIGRIEFYRFDAELDHIYTITVTPYDSDDVAGTADVTVEITSVSGGFAPPSLPRDISPQAGDRRVAFTWLSSPDIAVVSYRIYKKTGQITTTATDWTLLDAVPSSINHFEDFGLENDQVYSYYITSVDLYGQESLHLPDDSVNLNYVEITPKAAGILAEPDNVQLSLSGNDILISWDSLLEEFDSFEIKRSVGNLHLWETIATVDRNATTYLDEDVPLIDGTTFYYVVGKTLNDTDIVVQTTDTDPESSIFLGSLVLSSASFGNLETADRRDLLNLEDPVSEYTNTRLLAHRHAGIERFDPERIDLRPESVITDWETIDGRIFTTEEQDITGTGYVVKVNERFPQVLFEVDATTRRLIFSEAIVEVNAAGQIIGEPPVIEVKVLGISEVQNILPAKRFDKIHARQVEFGRLNKEQLPSINHEGRIKERLIPKRFNLERFSNHTFVIPQGDTDTTKNFGDGTTFYSVIEGDGLIDEIINWDQEDTGSQVGFRSPSFSLDTTDNVNNTVDIAEVTEDENFQSEKSYVIAFEFVDNDPTRWVRVRTFNAAKKPNPIVDLKKRIRFKMLTERSIYVALGIREIAAETGNIGSDGGITGTVEWVGVTSTLTDSNGDAVPLGKHISGSPDWQEVEFDLEKDAIEPFSLFEGSPQANGILEGVLGTLEHIAFTIDPNQTNPAGPIYIYIDKLEQVDDILAAGTSQGIQLSRDFGTSWTTARYVETPIHKFYKAINNPFIWAVGTNTVLIATDLEFWFETSGLTGVQFIRDIVEDDFGNMYVSTDKGVYWFEIEFISNFSSWRQTQPINAFTTDCYGLYHNSVSSGIDEIWVSTEVGIFKTIDQGNTWTDTGMSTQDLPAFQFMNISSDSSLPTIICSTRKHILRKIGSETDFSVLANFEVQHDIFDIWVFEFFAGRLYVSTGKGVYSNSVDELFIPAITTAFERVLPGLDVNGQVGVAFGLDAIVSGSNEEQLFIGQENRIMVSTEDNVLSIKEQFPNKELPSFYRENTELNIGYVYNAFNNVLVFRSPQPVNTIYKAANIPRKIYLPLNGGWAQTNPGTDAFIYVNGLPKWLDFKLDEDQILNEIQILQGKLSNMDGTLTDFNSLDPDAKNALTLVLADIDAMLTGGEEGAALINNTTIIQFLDDYTRFLSLINNSVVLGNDLDVFPKINVAGFPASQREANSRAEILEEQEEFVANDSTGINIDTVTGEVDFLTIFNSTTNQDTRQEYVFDKHDRMLISIFKANVSNTGEFTHRSLEDQMEAVNTGLTSHLSRAHYTNLIKAGIFMETRHNYLFDQYRASNVQSKFYASHTNDWYDILNSTIDYNSIITVSNNDEAQFANVMTVFRENPYLPDKIWVGTNSDILQYDIDTDTGTLTLDNLIRPGNGPDALFIWDIHLRTEEDIYVVAEEKDTGTGRIFRSVDSGITWTELDTLNLPQQIYQFSILSGNKVAATESGIYYCDNDFGTWFPSTLGLSNQLSDTSPSVDAFTSRIRNIETTTFMLAESDRWFYTSGSGLDWFAVSGQITSNSVSVVNKVVRYKSLTWVATDKGIYNDGNSVLGETVQFGLQTGLEDSSAASAALNVSDIATGADSLYCAAENAVYRLLDGAWSKYEVADVGSIHKMLLVETEVKDWIILVSHNLITTIDATLATGVFD